MTHTQALLLVCAALGMLGLVLLICDRAPYGWQDRDGFHLGHGEDEL